MAIRDILRRLTEDELELLQEEIDNDLYQEIENVLDEKSQPSLFADKYKEGDVFLFQTGLRRCLYRIKESRNPYFDCEMLDLYSNHRVGYAYHAEVKASEIVEYKKVDKAIWDKLKTSHGELIAKVNNLHLEYRDFYNKIIGEEMEKLRVKEE